MPQNLIDEYACTERQLDGTIVIVVIKSIFLAISYFSSLLPAQISDIPFGDRSFGPVVVGLTGNAGFNGIFYVRKEARVCDLMGAAGIRNSEPFDQKMLSERLSTGKTVIIESHGRLRIVEMNNGIRWPSAFRLISIRPLWKILG